MRDDKRLSARDGRTARAALSLVLLTAVGAGSCYWDDDVAPGTVDYYYEYYYPYTYYYPVDLAYSSYYWTDYYYYYDWYWQKDPPVEAQAPTNTWSAVGSFVRALARGEAVCPGQVTVTPKMGPPACMTADNADVRTGVTLVFNGCQTPNGGKLDGTIDVTAMRNASEQTCSSNTRISLSHTTTITDLSYTAPSGQRLVIPNQTDTGTNSFTYGTTPSSLTFNSSGRVQVYGTNGSLAADLNHNGTRMVSYNSSNKTYTVSGLAAIEDTRSSARGSVLGDGVTRSSECCNPIGGTVKVTRTGGNSPGEHTWTFGPSCGQATLDGVQTAPPACQ